MTCYQQKMKQKLVKPIDRILLRKRSWIETINGKHLNISQNSI
nr:transposase [cyanobacterium endosymbiont of Rhopalodia gibberula]